MKIVSYVWLTLLVTLSTWIGASIDTFDVEDAIARIERHVSLINKYNKKNKPSLSGPSRIVPDCQGFDCKHELTRLCIKKMSNERCFEPIVEIWSLFNRNFNHIEREIFVREFVCILYAVYNSCISQLTVNKKSSSDSSLQITAPSMAAILTLYNQVSGLPIIKVLNDLEDLYVALVALMDDYGVNEQTDWREWAVNNWWVPPVMLVAVFYSLVKTSTSYRLPPMHPLGM